MLGLPIEAIMNQFQPGAPGIPEPTVKPSQPKEKPKKASIPKPQDLATAAAAPMAMPKITQEQQLKLLELEKQLQDPAMQMLMANGLINPAALCGLDAETAKLLGLQPATSTPSKGVAQVGRTNERELTRK